MKCLALDFGGSSIKYALVDENANMEKSGKVPAPLDSEEQFVKVFRGFYQHFKGEIAGIGISLPGYIDPDQGVLVDSGAYRQMYGKNILELFKPHCPIPIAIENDGKCAALAESWKGELKDVKSGAVLILGTAIGGGIIKDGYVHGGKDFTAGEFSYLITDPSIYGPMACAYMSSGMLGMTYRICKKKNLDLAVQDSAGTLLWLDSLIKQPYADAQAPLKPIRADGVQIFRWLEQDDADAQEVYHIFIHGLAVLIHSLQSCYAPEKVVIGGGLSLQPRIFDDIRADLEKFYQGNELGKQLQANIIKSRYLNECNLIGASRNLFQRMRKSSATERA